MASLVNPVCAEIMAHVLADTDVATVTVGYRDSEQREWPYAYILLDPAEVGADINNTRRVGYPATIGVWSHSFDETNEIVEALLVLWEENPRRAALTALGVDNLNVTGIHPGAMVPEIETDRGFYGEINFTLTIRHTF